MEGTTKKYFRLFVPPYFQIRSSAIDYDHLMVVGWDGSGGWHLGMVAGQYSMHVQLSPSDAVVVGGQLDVSCDIWNWQPERSMFVVWLRRAHGNEVELGTNENVVEQLRSRYSARKELRRPADFTRVSYYLTITGQRTLNSNVYFSFSVSLLLYSFIQFEKIMFQTKLQTRLYT